MTLIDGWVRMSGIVSGVVEMGVIVERHAVMDTQYRIEEAKHVCGRTLEVRVHGFVVIVHRAMIRSGPLSSTRMLLECRNCFGSG